jgi:hypothetical protein
MAISGDPSSPTTVRVALAAQSAWGTLNSTQTEYLELHITDVPSYDPLAHYMVDDTMRHDGQHQRGAKDSYKTTAGGTSLFQVSFIATFEDMELILPALFQNSDTVGDVTTYEWAYDTAAATGQSLTLLSMICADPQDNYSLHTCVPKTLECTVAPGSDGSRMRCNLTLMTGFPEATGATATVGSWTQPSSNYFSSGNLDVMLVNSEDFVLTSGTFTFDNGAVRFGNGASGVPEGYAIGISNKKGFECSGSITGLYDGVTEGWKALAKVNNAAQATPGYPISFIWNQGIKELRFNINAIIDNADIASGGETGMERTIPFRALSHSSTAGVSVVTDTNAGA